MSKEEGGVGGVAWCYKKRYMGELRYHGHGFKKRIKGGSRMRGEGGALEERGKSQTVTNWTDRTVEEREITRREKITAT